MASAPAPAPADPEAPRTGSALVRATFPYAVEDAARTWRLFGGTTVVWAAAIAVAAAPLPLPLRFIGSCIAGLTIVRLFIFFHDWAHGAVFRESRLGSAVMHLVGLYCMSPAPVWRETHDYHHRNNAKIVGAAIGSYPVVTTRMWRRMDTWQRRKYAWIRHPANMALGYLTVFAVGMCLAPLARDPKTHWQGPLALALHIVATAALAVLVDPLTAVLVATWPLTLGCAAGAYLFYAQHNFPDIQLKDRARWNYHFAALHSSSLFEMPAWLHWFTGNIGYHHVHHLNHKVPFYNLVAAMDGIPELQSPGRTSWRLADVRACLALKLWDPTKKQMVGWPER